MIFNYFLITRKKNCLATTTDSFNSKKFPQLRTTGSIFQPTRPRFAKRRDDIFRRWKGRKRSGWYTSIDREPTRSSDHNDTTTHAIGSFSSIYENEPNISFIEKIKEGNLFGYKNGRSHGPWRETERCKEGWKERGEKQQLIDSARVHFPSLNSKWNTLVQREGEAKGEQWRRRKNERTMGKYGGEEIFTPWHAIGMARFVRNSTM